MVRSRIFWYLRYATISKWMFRLGSIAVLIITATIAVFGYQFARESLAILSILIVVLRSIIDLFRWQDNWKRYRFTLEQMRSEMDLYLAVAGQYEELNNSERKKRFVTEILALSHKENHNWNRQRYIESEKS